MTVLGRALDRALAIEGRLVKAKVVLNNYNLKIEFLSSFLSGFNK